MARLLGTAAALLYCMQLARGFTTPKPKTTNPYDSFVGQPCRPPFGFRPNSCGDYEILTEVVTPAPMFVYGPNTCRFQRSIRTNELNYEYRKYCDWTYSHTYYAWVQQCQLICQPTRVCSNRNQTIETSGVQCCPGFESRPAVKTTDHYSQYYQQHFTQINTEPVGCPLAVGETIAQCLMLHNLTRFLSLAQMSRFSDLINSNNSGVTVLAPTNAAFDLLDPQLFITMDIDMLVGNHIIEGLIPKSMFTHNRRFTSLDGLTLHSTLIHFPDYSVITYIASDRYSSNTLQFREMRFINGAGILNADACRTDNGTLHIIDRVLMPSDENIASILENDPRFSMFVDALMFAGTFDFLEQNDSSHTVFAPTNDAFARDIPPDLFNCLTSYQRVPLTNLILYHISKQTDYSQVLSLRQSAFTLFTDYRGPRSILVFTTENGTILLGNLGSQVPITTADIPANNGVIHVIDGVLMPADFDYGKCQEFVPTTPPPTTLPPTTPAPMTTAPPTTAAPMTTPNVTDAVTTAPPTIMAPPNQENDGSGDTETDGIDYSSLEKNFK